jgi:nuclear GTP-binding protein
MEEDGAAQRALEQLTGAAAAKQADFETRKRARLTGGAGGPGDQDGSRRAFYKEFRRVVEASDVVIQVRRTRRTQLNAAAQLLLRTGGG